MAVRKVEVVPYNSTWTELFQKETQKLTEVMEPYEIVFHHIGSTSVPGLGAKPIIDLLAEAEDILNFDRVTPKLEKMGYVAKGEYGIVGRRYFYKEDENGQRLFHLHAFEKGNTEIYRHLVFRDYLREHPEEAKRYESVKMIAAKKFPHDIDSYINYKDSIVKEIEGAAFRWADKK